jgi:hypothetical protein
MIPTIINKMQVFIMSSKPLLFANITFIGKQLKMWRALPVFEAFCRRRILISDLMLLAHIMDIV